jgi:phage terminase large subunit
VSIQIPEAFEFLFTPARYKVVYGGRGKGATENIARVLLIQGIQQSLPTLCTREFQASIQDSVHRVLATTIMKENLADQYEVLQSVIRHRHNGTEFLFKGLKHNITEIKGFHGIKRVWAEEAENISNRSWEVLIPTIREPDSEIWVSFNPRNANDPTFERFVTNAGPESIVRKLSWRDNPFFPEVLRKEMEKLKKIDPEAYQHIWEGEFDTRRSGAVFAKQLAKAREEQRITIVPYDPSSEVFTAWDLGFGDSTAIWFLQFVGRELRWLDYYENNGEQLDHYAALIKSKPYNYYRNGHYLPHDGGHGNIRGDSVTAQLDSLGIKNQVLTRETDINPGIELLRQTIAYSVFDKDKCKDGIHALENYAYEWDEDKAVFKKKPKHDWSSHAASAARYAAIAAGMVKNRIGAKPPPKTHTQHASPWSL